MPPALAHLDTWIFDLDNTLYPHGSNLFAKVDARMTLYVQRLLDCGPDEALRVQKELFHAHGTTVAGLMQTRGIDPHEFLEFVHDVELDALVHDRDLVERIAALPGRKLVFTNGDAPYAQRVLDRLGLGESFEAIHDIHAMDYVPKPAPASYAALCERWNVEPKQALFAEDMVRNLKPAKDLGMTTLWIDNGSEQAGVPACPSFVDYRTHDLSHWLGELMETA